MLSDYLQTLACAFAQQSSIANAVPMQAYMREQFPFYGIKSPERKAILKHFIKSEGLPQRQEWQKVIQEMWKQPEREWQYCAQELARKCKKYWQEDAVELFEWLILQKSWWDTVDYISSHLVAEYFKKSPQNMKAITSKWANSKKYMAYQNLNHISKKL